MSVKPTNIPKCHLRQSADSAGNFSRHGKLGEVTENIRTFALPFESKPYTFKMCFEYDSWNRVQNMTYPDGEKVSYGYNLGGMLYSIEGDKGGQAYMYVEHIAYNKYELKESVLYGNGSFTTYDYDNLMRLAHLQSFTGAAAEQNGYRTKRRIPFYLRKCVCPEQCRYECMERLNGTKFQGFLRNQAS